MSQSEKNSERFKAVPNLVKDFGQLYGPYAFGVVSLLIIWFSIVKPELTGRQLDYEAHLKITRELVETSDTHKEISLSLASTAQSLNMTATILERTVERMDRINSGQ